MEANEPKRKCPTEDPVGGDSLGSWFCSWGSLAWLGILAAATPTALLATADQGSRPVRQQAAALSPLLVLTDSPLLYLGAQIRLTVNFHA
jgi:hypothetical protein